MPAKNAKFLSDQVFAISPRVGDDIRRSIFLHEDIIKLENDIIKGIIKSIHHQLLVRFLASTDKDVREKFLLNLTKRAAAIIEEDIEMIGELTQQEKDLAINEMVNTIRVVLKFK